MLRGASGRLWGPDPLRIPLPLGLGPLFGLARLPDRLPARARATFRPKTAQDRQQRSQERPKTANIGPKSCTRPPTKAPRAAKTAHAGPKSSPRPPTEVPRVGQDRQHRLQEWHKTANTGPESGQDHPQRTRRSWEDLPQYFKIPLRS